MFSFFWLFLIYQQLFLTIFPLLINSNFFLPFHHPLLNSSNFLSNICNISPNSQITKPTLSIFNFLMIKLRNTLQQSLQFIIKLKLH